MITFSFSILRSLVVCACFSCLFSWGLNAQNSPASLTPETQAVADVGAPVIGCATVIPSGSFVLAEHFFTTYEYAFRQVAKLRAYGFADAQLLHTDCQTVDVTGDFYIVTISPIVQSEAALYKMMESLHIKARKAGIHLNNLRIVRAQD